MNAHKLTAPKLLIPALVLLGGLATALLAPSGGTGSGPPSPLAEEDDSGTERRGGRADGRRELARRSAGGGSYTAAVGTRLSFSFRLANTVRMAGPRGTAGDPEGLHLEGAIRWTVLQRRDEEVLLALELPELRVRGEGPAGLASSLRRPIPVRMQSDGRTTGIVFPENLDPLGRNVLRTVLAAFRFIVPTAHGPHWEVRDADATGEFTACLTVRERTEEGMVIDRRKSYVELGGGFAKEATHAALGAARATFDSRIGWLAGADVDEALHVTIEVAKVKVTSRLVGALRLAGVEVLDAASMPEMTWDQSWLPAAGGAEDLGELARGRIEGYWRQRLRGETLDSLLARITGLLRAGKGESIDLHLAMEELGWLIKLRPDLAQEVALRVRGGALTERLAGLLVAALGHAGTPAAQTSLTGIYRDSGSRSLQEAAAVAMFQIAKPTADLVRAVLDRVASLSKMDSLGATSLLLLGALAPRSEAALDASGGRLLDRLLGLEQHARRLGAADVWLQALGNSGTKVALERARPYFRSSEEWERAGAVSAVRKLETPAAFDLLSERAARDPSLPVRARAIETLAASRESGAERRLVDLLHREKDVHHRRLVLMGLGRHAARNGAAARRALQTSASRDPSPVLRRLAQRLLRQT